jgi:septum site-determining protein MinC
MAAQLIQAQAAGLPHLLRLPPSLDAASAPEEVHIALEASELQGPLTMEAGDWLLRLPQLRQLQKLLASRGLRLMRLRSASRESLVAAAALGLETEWIGSGVSGNGSQDQAHCGGSRAGNVAIQRGTLRSGDHLQVEGTALVLGDVNPGARVSAGGHVLVWGRLLGTAHAGRHGDPSARIMALQLRPLQLRIADAVARGPEEVPPEGLAEQAHLVDGAIRIDPAPPHWPVPA